MIMAAAHGVASEAVRTQLQSIVICQEFDASERNRRFLKYVVEETLAGRPERIKAYSIATSVFGREASFDPQTDPIIRIEASRLRRSLERYYLTSGRDDPVRIEIPKGSYVPTFRFESTNPPAPALPATEHTSPASLPPGFDIQVDPAPSPRDRVMRRIATGAALLGAVLMAWLGITWFGQYPPFAAKHPATSVVDRGPTIFVAPFDSDGGDRADVTLTRGLTREVIVGLTRFDGLLVYGPETTFLYGTATDENRRIQDLGVEYILAGGVTASEDRLRVAVSLVDAKTGRNLWSDMVDRELAVGGILQAREVIADQVVQALAQPNGILFREETKQIDGTPLQLERQTEIRPR